MLCQGFPWFYGFGVLGLVLLWFGPRYDLPVLLLRSSGFACFLDFVKVQFRIRMPLRSFEGSFSNAVSVFLKRV